MEAELESLGLLKYSISTWGIGARGNGYDMVDSGGNCDGVPFSYATTNR